MATESIKYASPDTETKIEAKVFPTRSAYHWNSRLADHNRPQEDWSYVWPDRPLFPSGWWY